MHEAHVNTWKSSFLSVEGGGLLDDPELWLVNSVELPPIMNFILNEEKVTQKAKPIGVLP